MELRKLLHRLRIGTEVCIGRQKALRPSNISRAIASVPASF